MVPDNKNNVDPTVQAIVEMFPDDFLRNTARETGVVEGERKIDVLVLFWVTTLEFGVRFLSAVRGLKRKYEEPAKKSFKDLVIQDSTIIQLHESLAKIWPAARKRELIHAFTLGKGVYATSRPIIS
jgi:hypothetical protein